MKTYKKLSTWAKEHDIQYLAAWKMAKSGQIKTETLPTGSIRVIEELENTKEEKVIIYTRVSNSINKNNLETQKERLKNYCIAKGYKIDSIIGEIGSGLNDERPKWLQLLGDNTVTKIVVEHKDRFTRFGFNGYEKLLNSKGVEIEVVNKADEDKQDLMEDFISIITSYCARIYGSRRSKRKTEKIIKELTIQDNES